MEKVLSSKLSWLCSNTDWEILLVTLDQHGLPPVYTLPERVRHINLDINYDLNARLPFFRKLRGFIALRSKHHRDLETLLAIERPDIVVSLYPTYSAFLPQLSDGSRKVLECHFNRNFRIYCSRIPGRGILTRLNDFCRYLTEYLLVRRFDRFIVLTDADSKLWGNPDNISVIPNFAPDYSMTAAPEKSNRVIAVGRASWQKGFDVLVRAWGIVMSNPDADGWSLDIFGDGEMLPDLKRLAIDLDVASSITFHGPTENPEHEYSSSAINVLSSRYEGFAMVILEAMTVGLPTVAFDCQCGPAGLIEDGATGFLATPGDAKDLADKILRLIRNPEMRYQMGCNAKKRAADFYSRDKVMSQWIDAMVR